MRGKWLDVQVFSNKKSNLGDVMYSMVTIGNNI